MIVNNELYFHYQMVSSPYYFVNQSKLSIRAKNKF